MIPETFAQVLIAVLPALSAVISVVAIAVKILRKFTGLKKEFSEKTDYKEIQKAMNKLVDENMRLNQEIRRLENKMNHVYNGGEGNGAVTNNKKIR